ncbi:MAG: hypothetical protein IPL78_04295 [Chloroflexi bacterium]|nr:hypothetical protein [Chloroflexota bacterium]
MNQTLTMLLAELATPLLQQFPPQPAVAQQITLTWETMTGEQHTVSCPLPQPNQAALLHALASLPLDHVISSPVKAMQIALTPLPQRTTPTLSQHRQFYHQAHLVRPQHPLPERRFAWQTG